MIAVMLLMRFFLYIFRILKAATLFDVLFRISQDLEIISLSKLVVSGLCIIMRNGILKDGQECNSLTGMFF